MHSVAELIDQATQHQRNGQLSEAARTYQQVLRIQPDHAQAWHQLGLIAFYGNQHQQAIDCISRAIRLDGSQAVFHHNLAASCRALGRLDDAQTSYEQALRLDPGYVSSLGHLWLTLRAAGLAEQADACLKRLLAAQPRTADENALLGTLMISLGHWAEGWRRHEFRDRIPLVREPRASADSKWDGSHLAGRQLLLYSEQGLGDTLQWVRYVPLVEQRGAQPILAVQSALIPLLAESRYSRLTDRAEAWPKHDLELGMFSLPFVFGTTLENLPAQVPYLRARPDLVAHWRARLADIPGFRVGIHWQGNAAYNFDRTRSIPLAQFAPLANVAGVRLVSLQKSPGSEQLNALAEPFPIVDLEAELDVAHGAFMDTAAVMLNLDLVITSDTATAHLAGALGVPVWVALSTMPDFRWMYDREDCPWYPTMRLFRQQVLGDWAEVFARIAGELRASAAQHLPGK